MTFYRVTLIDSPCTYTGVRVSLTYCDLQWICEIYTGRNAEFMFVIRWCIQRRWYKSAVVGELFHSEYSCPSINVRDGVWKALFNPTSANGSLATLFNYIISNRIVVKLKTCRKLFIPWGCFTFHLFKAKPRRAPNISAFHSVRDGRINFS